MIKRLLSCVGEYKKSSIFTMILMSLEVTTDVITPRIMANLIDDGIDQGNLNVILKLGAYLLVTICSSLFFGLLAGRTSSTASAGLAKNLRKEMFANVQDFSFSNIDRLSTTSIVTRLTTDVTNVERAYHMFIRVAVRAPIMLIFSLFMAFGINNELSMVFLFAIPILGVGFYIMIKKAHPIFERVFETYDRLNNVVQENLRGIRVVKSYVREDFEKEKFNEVSYDIFKDFSKAEKILAFNGPMMQFYMYTCIILMSWFGAKMIVSSTLTTGALMSLITYAVQILMSLMMLSMVFVMIIISRASAERIVEILDEKSDITNKENPIMHVEDGSIVLENVSFSYTQDKNKFCLSDADIVIKSGETVGIIGGTGTSKTTLVQLIPRLYDTTEGKVLVGGVDVKDYDIKTLRDQVAMVLQKNVLFSGTIKENLRWGNENATDEELIHACKLSQADDFINSFPKGYDTYIEQGGVNVSGGQKQRLCIARALLKKPKILILDDSTSAVDTKTDALIRRAFKEEIPNTTKLIIAQRISSIEDADKIIVLEGGKVNAIGNHEELLKNNTIYQEVYNSQEKGGDEHESK